MLYYVYFSDAGVPKTGLTPDFEYLKTAENSTDKSGSAPAITEIGGGFYKFDITLGTAPWDVTTEDLVGVIDGGSSLADVDRYKSMTITKRGQALARIGHKTVQTKSTGDVIVYAADDTTEEMKFDITDAAATITIAIAAPS